MIFSALGGVVVGEHGADVRFAGGDLDESPQAYKDMEAVMAAQGTPHVSREAARRHLFDTMEFFYNRQRLHSILGYRRPASVVG